MVCWLKTTESSCWLSDWGPATYPKAAIPAESNCVSVSIVCGPATKPRFAMPMESICVSVSLSVVKSTLAKPPFCK